MTVSINNENIHIETNSKTIGQVLTELDEMTERAGQIIIEIVFNGKSVAADAIPSLSSTPCKTDFILQLTTHPVRYMRIEAIDIVLGIIQSLKAAKNNEELTVIHQDLLNFAQRYSGLFSAEENSFIDNLGKSISAKSSNGSREFGATLDKTASFLCERRQEAENPALAMLNTRRLFAALRPELEQVSVKLQTGKDSEAMRTMVLAVELINKTVRLLPDYVSTLASELIIEGQSVEDFYADFNTVLSELMEAFEHKDSVLIGDLAEYEIVPRMQLFFTALPDANTMDT